MEVTEGEGPRADGLQLRQGQQRRLVRLQKLLQLRYQIAAVGPSEAAHSPSRSGRGQPAIDLRARYEIEGVGVASSKVLPPAYRKWLGHIRPRKRARRQRKKPDWGNGGHGPHGTRAGRAPARPRGHNGGEVDGARASTCGCCPDSAGRLGRVDANWLCRSRISSAFCWLSSKNKNSAALGRAVASPRRWAGTCPCPAEMV